MDKIPVFIKRTIVYLQAHKRHGAVVICVCALLLASYAVGDAGRDWLAFYRSKVEAGQGWRIYTGQWVHFTWTHAWMNIAATAAVLFTLFFTIPVSRSIVAIVVLPLLVGLGLLWLSNDVEHYRGYSAAIHGLITCGLLLNFKQDPWLMGVGLLGVTGKVLYEQTPYFDVNNMRDQIASAVAVDAHLYGYVAGIALAAMFVVAPIAVGWFNRFYRLRS